MNVDLFNLERFVTAQDAYNSYNIALEEIKAGQKRTHWMWYVFPQIKGLGHSDRSRKFAISSLLEAKAYLEHDTLGGRLREAVEALPAYGNAERIFGHLDAMKLHSCLTLFDIVSPHGIFANCLYKYFGGERCESTLKTVSTELLCYEGDNAFERNGVREVPRAFLERIDGSAQLTGENVTGTLLDLFGRGETMRKLLCEYLWVKDAGNYRVSCISNALLVYMRDTLLEIARNSKDDVLHKEMKGMYDRCLHARDIELFQVVDAFDEFLKKYWNDARVKPVIDNYMKESLCKYIHRPEYTPDAIERLRPDEVFVFGSNLEGKHGSGAARAALDKFGAVWGQGVGLQGQSYAIPTMHGGVEAIKPYVDGFIDFAKEHTGLFFYVTRIGCGIAGFKDSQIAPLFKDAVEVPNICLPKSFVDILG